MDAASCRLEGGSLLRLVCRLHLLVLLELRMRLIVLDVRQSRSDRLLTRQHLLQKGHDCWVCCCDGRDGSTPLPCGAACTGATAASTRTSPTSICPCPSPIGPPELASPMLKVDQF